MLEAHFRWINDPKPPGLLECVEILHDLAAARSEAAIRVASVFFEHCHRMLALPSLVKGLLKVTAAADGGQEIALLSAVMSSAPTLATQQCVMATTVRSVLMQTFQFKLSRREDFVAATVTARQRCAQHSSSNVCSNDPLTRPALYQMSPETGLATATLELLTERKCRLCRVLPPHQNQAWHIAYSRAPHLCMQADSCGR
jgi:hypothetical protein